MQAADSARKRAELRFSQANRELEAQREDLVALAAQFGEAKEPACAPSEFSNHSRVRRLQTIISEKELKLQGLREALITLKNEFVAAEEVHQHQQECAECESSTKPEKTREF